MRFGLSDFVENLGRGRVAPPRISPVALRKALCELGPAFIKLGQILSTRDELLPQPFREELAKLQDQVPPFPTELAKALLDSEFGVDSSSIFAEFDPVALASGSIGQVHRARLKDGTEVVAKIQRPGVEEVLARDTAIIRHLSDAFGGQPQTRAKAAQLVSDFLAATESELDYIREADQLERFAWQFEHEPSVHVPRLIRAYSSRRILTMTYVPGVKLSEFESLGDGIDRKSAARRLGNCVLKQIFSFGHFHGDPHAANVFVTKDESIGFYDLGLVGELSRDERECVAALLLALLEQQADIAMHALLKLARSSHPPDTHQLRDDVSRLMAQYFRRPSDGIPVHRLLQDILEITAQHELTLPAAFYLVFKVLATLDSTGRSLDPEFDLVALALPVLRRTRPPGQPTQLDAASALDISLETLVQLRDLPAAIRNVLGQLQDGQLRIQFEHRGIDEALSRYEGAGNRLSSVIFASALMLGCLCVIGFSVQARLLNLSQAALATGCVALLSILVLWLITRLAVPRVRKGRG